MKKNQRSASHEGRILSNLCRSGGLSLLLTFLLLFTQGITVNAQISGLVFRDFNGNGTRENTTGTFVEPLAPGVIVTAYNSSDVIVASYTTTAAGTTNYTIPASGTAYNGTLGSNTGFAANTTAVRLEFTIPNSVACLVNGLYDFSSKSGKIYGTSVRFIASGAAARTGNNFALNNPSDYVGLTTANTFLFQAVQFNGNPTAASGTSTTQNALVKFPYNISGNTGLTAAQILASSAQIGSVYGVAYSKYAKKVFTSAYMKRHSGFGPSNGTFNNAPGTIYIVDPSLSSTTTTKAASFFVSLDALGYPTHNATGTPAWGAGTSYTLSTNGSTTANLRTEAVSYPSAAALGVIGTNTVRGLSGTKADPSYDPAAFGQIGRVSLGSIEMSEDGRFLFVVNLYDRKIYQLQLNSITNPTAATYVNSWALPNPPARSASGLSGAATTYASETAAFYDGTRGLQRPFALKYYRGKLYVGAVTTGEGTGAVSTTDNNSGNVEFTDLWSYVWELTPSVGFANTTPILQFPLNYDKGTNTDGYNETWKPWTSTMPASFTTGFGNQWSATQPMFTGIEFDVDGTMIIALRDRSGDQGGYANYMLSSATTTSRTAMAFGDQLRAYKNPTGCTYQLESAGKEGAASSKAATAGATNGQGPGGGEFYFQDGVEMFNGGANSGRYHLNTAMGGLALLPGMEEVTATYMDPLAVWSGGPSWMNNNDGTNPRDFQVYIGNAVGDLGKANGLGDIEMLSVTPPIEIGNRVWRDANGDGIQGADEAGIAGVLLELVDATGNAVDGDVTTTGVQATYVTTDANGNWYITSDTGTDATGINYNVDLAPNTTYTVRLATSTTGNDWDPTLNGGSGAPRAGGDLVGLSLTVANKAGNGAANLSDSDASSVSGVPQMSVTTGIYGQNDHSLDIGFAPGVNIGNKVWIDANNNGIFDSGELPLVGATVKLYAASATDGVPATPATPIATVTTDANGYYLFDNLLPGTYVVSVMNPAGYISSTVNTTTPNTVDNDDNGVRTLLGETFSNTITLAVGTAPTGETPSNNPAGNVADNSSNLTIDFGFVAAVNVGNKVWIDANNNGLFDSGELPVVGATVKLYTASATDGIPATPASPLLTTTTDATGYYLFDNLVPGSYVISVMNPAGYTSSTVNTTTPNTVDNDDNGVRTVSGETFSNTITLAVGTAPTGETPNTNPAGNIADNSSNLTIDFGFVAAVNVGNKVWIDANNNGLFDSGELPVVGATVKLYTASGTDGVPATPATPRATTTTDANGYYLFDNLVPGAYVISVMNPTGYISSTVNTTTPNTVDNDDNGVRTVSGETFSNTITLAVGTAPTGETPNTNPAGNIADNSSNLTIDFGFVAVVNVGNKVWIDANNNGLFDSGELPIVGATVKLYTASGTDGVPATPATALLTTTTDANGYYLFDNLFPGNYVISVMNPAGYTSSTVNTTSPNNVDNDDNGIRTVSGETFSNTITLAVGTAPTGETPSTNPAGNIADNSSNLTIDFGFVAAVNIGNKVWIDANNNGLFESTEQPVVGATVKLYTASGTDGVPATPATPLATTTTDATGYYLFNNLVPGNYVVSVMNPAGYVSSTVNASSANNDIDNDDNGVRTVSGETFSNTITLTVGGEPTGETPNTNPAGNIADNSSNLTLDFGFVAVVNVGNKVWIDANNNGLFDSGELPVIGATVKLYTASGTDGVPATPATALLTTTTDANGYYLFDNLFPGNYVISVMNPAGYISSSVNTTSPNNVDNDDNGVRTLNKETFSNTITLAVGTAPTGETPSTNPAGNIADNSSNLTIDFGFVAAVNVGNKVWNDVNKNGLFDSGESAITGATVKLYLASNTNGVPATPTTPLATTTTDGSGYYLFDNLLPGNYVISVMNPTGYTSSPVDALDPNNKVDNDDNGVRTSNGETFSNTITLAVGTAPTGETPNTNPAGNIADNSSNLTVDFGFFFTPLPVALVNFNGQAVEKQSVLSWNTTAETNSAYFEVQRSTDGKNWTSLGTVLAKGESSDILSYGFTDGTPTNGENLYRLKMVDLDQTFGYSRIISIKLEVGYKLSLFPNPASDFVKIEASDASSVNKVQVYSLIGKLVQEVASPKGGEINVQNLPAGMYLLKITTSNGSVETRKVVIVR